MSEKTFQTMKYALYIIVLISVVLVLTGCVTQYFEKGAHPAQTEHEYYIEGQSWKYAAELGVQLDSVTFADTPYVGMEGPSDGWLWNKDIWYWEDSVNNVSWTNSNRDELAWHEVCHLKVDNHSKAWCECMTRKFHSIYCKEG